MVGEHPVGGAEALAQQSGQQPVSEHAAGEADGGRVMALSQDGNELGEAGGKRIVERPGQHLRRHPRTYRVGEVGDERSGVEHDRSWRASQWKPQGHNSIAVPGRDLEFDGGLRLVGDP